MTKLPDGVELDLNFYMTDDEGIAAKFSVKGLRLIPAALDNPNVDALFKAFHLGELGGGRWRAMTRAEISEFKENEEA